MTPNNSMSDLMVNRVEEEAVARVLMRIASANRGERLIPKDLQGDFDFWFDGGAAKVETGFVVYHLTDGTRVTVGAPLPALSLSIRFPDGREVKVQQEPSRAPPAAGTAP